MPHEKKKSFRRKSKHGKHASKNAKPGENRAVPRVNPALASYLAQIGQPASEPFREDPFQTRAIGLIRQGDVIVSVPTGAGKTYVAACAMADVLAHGGRCWYASPLKALSNSKFLEFGAEFGEDRVGLLTGDLKVRPDADIVVGTTEILRNQLYDAMREGQDLGVDLVVMDEAHYLGDMERGVVWEEIIIYLPPRVKLLMLSATIANARQLAAWMESVRGVKTECVLEAERPVPLMPVFLFPWGELAPFLGKKGGLFEPVARFNSRKNKDRRGNLRAGFDVAKTMRLLDEADLLPAIFFLKSRADCDAASQACLGLKTRYSGARAKKLASRVAEHLARYPFLGAHAQLPVLLSQGVASHHAGQLPHWKLIVEDLMQRGLLAAVFSTSTMAAGVNFPARTVALTQSDRFDGQGFSDLTATELAQMTGRAGRRGMDKIGFALVLPGPFLDTELVASLMNSETEPVTSRIRVNFSMAMNLLESHEPADIKALYERSLASFQLKDDQGGDWIDRAMEDLTAELTPLLAGGACLGPMQAALLSNRLQTLNREKRRLEKNMPLAERASRLVQALDMGRLFARAKGKPLVAVKRVEQAGRDGILAARPGKIKTTPEGKIRLKWVPLESIETVFEHRYDIASGMKTSTLINRLLDMPASRLRPMDLAGLEIDPFLGPLGQAREALARTRQELKEVACQSCPIQDRCLGDEKSQAAGVIHNLARLAAEAQTFGRSLWSDFLFHLEFLKAEGFVGPDNRLTQDGAWAAKLRLDHPLVVAAAIRKNAWPETDPVLLAACAAPFVVDHDKKAEAMPGRPDLPQEFFTAFERVNQAVEPICRRLASWGFATPEIKPRPALAIWAWAEGEDWDQAVALYGLHEGDMAMLAFRTADYLRQMANLTQSHPRLAMAAAEGVRLILREPVLVPF